VFRLSKYLIHWNCSVRASEGILEAYLSEAGMALNLYVRNVQLIFDCEDYQKEVTYNVRDEIATGLNELTGQEIEILFDRIKEFKERGL